MPGAGGPRTGQPRALFAEKCFALKCVGGARRHVVRGSEEKERRAPCYYLPKAPSRFPQPIWRLGGFRRDTHQQRTELLPWLAQPIVNDRTIAPPAASDDDPAPRAHALTRPLCNLALVRITATRDLFLCAPAHRTGTCQTSPNACLAAHRQYRQRRWARRPVEAATGVCL